MPDKPIGQSMVEAKLLSPKQLDEALSYQRRSSERIPLGRLSVELGLVKEDDFAPFLASYFNVPYLDLKKYPNIQPETVEIIPESIARRFNVLPLMKDENTLTVAVSDPLDLTALENLKTITHRQIKSVVSPASQIRRRITAYYTGEYIETKTSGLTDSKEKEAWPFASSLVKLLTERAHRHGVNSVHIQPEENRVKIFFRVGKRLEKIASYPKDVLPHIVDFIKKASNLDSGSSNVPQAGYFTFSREWVNTEVGVSVFPTVWGERIVLEIPRPIGWLDEDAWFRPV